jgi:exodeoxyribonuclease VII small subunit
LAQSSQTTSTTEPVSFEQALTLLEQIVHDLEEGRLGLAESLARYEEGVKLLRQCHGLLEQAERRIELVTGMDAVGNPLTEPFDDVATFSEPAQPPTRSRRRASKKSTAEQQSEMPPENESADAMDEPGSLF